MKKWMCLALCLTLLMPVLAGSASAEEPEAEGQYTTNVDGTVRYDAAEGTYTASYDQAINGNQYALLVVKYDSVADGTYTISEDSIMYIDQKAAGTNGEISFEFIPRSTPDCVVLLGGVFSDGKSPKVLGTLAGQGVTVSGSVKYQINGAQSRPATVTLYDDQNQQVATAQTDGAGNYTLESVPVGSGYTLVVEKLGYLTYRQQNIEIAEAGRLDEIDISALGGDIDGDGNVYADDFQLLLQDFNNVGNLINNEAADIDGSGAVYSIDFSILLQGFNKIEE